MISSAEEDNKRMRRQRAERGFSDEDVDCIWSWFLHIIPKMLEHKAKHIHEIPTCMATDYCRTHHLKSITDLEQEDQTKVGQWCLKRWVKTLQYIAFLFGEGDEYLCSKRNPYQKEHDKASSDYMEKYGLFGSKVKDSPYNKVDELGRKSTVVNDRYRMANLPEYREIEQKYQSTQQQIEEYQQASRKKAFRLLKKYFYDL